MNNQLFSSETTSTYFAGFIAKVYGWMSVGVFISFVISFVVYFLIENNNALSTFVYIAMIPSFILQLILVGIISGLGNRMNTLLTGFLFIVYSALMGVTLSAFTMQYTTSSILTTFLVAFLTFAVMSIFGLLVKTDLTRLGSLLLFALVGLIIGTIINFILYFIFPQLASGISWVLTYIGLGIFIAMVATDTQELKKIAAYSQENGITNGRLAIQGALKLYLNFINILIRLLFIFGKRR